MSIVIVQNGSQIAHVEHSFAGNCAYNPASPKTLVDLLAILAESSPKGLPMLKSTASRFAQYCGMSIEEITLDRLSEMRGGFRQYLENAPYAENSKRSYVNYSGILLKLARKAGWRQDQNLSDDWRMILSLASKPKNRCADAVRFLANVKCSPRAITKEDVENWHEVRLQQGVSHRRLMLKASALWRLLRECGMTDYRPLSSIRAVPYKVPREQLAGELRMDIDQLLKWKTADFSIGRKEKWQIRQETATTILNHVCRLYGFETKIRGLSGSYSLSQLVREELVTDYFSWCINERGVQGETLRNHWGRLEVAMRQHPKYKSLDLSWFKSLLESLPAKDESARRMRKEKKYVEYAVVDSIPAKIRAERLSMREGQESRMAWLAMQELLIKWTLVLPWRQRNLRECRIGGSQPNIFRAKAPNQIDMPKWVRNEAERDPNALFWQIRFAPKETKTGREVRAFVPRQLIASLEEYLAKFRPLILRNGDPGTLFLTQDGAPMERHHIYSLFTHLTFVHCGRHVNPHLFRDIVAFEWLKTHPKDFLTLSKILWHSNINVTIRTYGGRFDESSGVCAMEEWLEEREAKSK